MPEETVTLTNFRIKTYRSCKDVSLSPSERLTALIGPNDIGKTNIMHAGNKILYKSSFTYSQNDSPKDQVVIADENWNFKSITGKSQWVKEPDITNTFAEQQLSW